MCLTREQLLDQACRYIEGLQSMQAMPSKEFDDEVDKFLTQVKGMLEIPGRHRV